MADIPAYFVGCFTAEDQERYHRYEKGFFPILKRYNGRFITFDDHPNAVEGSLPEGCRVVMFSFPSEAEALAWYNDPDYQELAEDRRGGGTTHFLTLVHGLPPRG